MKRSELNFNDDAVIIEIFECAVEVLGGGIAVPTSTHPCGWDWLDLEFIGKENILEHQFESSDISNGYGNSEYEGLTLREILLKTNGKFAFQVGCCTIDWEHD